MPKKPRLPRVERSDHIEIEDDTGHIWAISYADFLMVLLSFFILFFSVNEETKEDVIKTISELPFADAQAKNQPGSTEETISGVPVADLKNSFADLSIQTRLSDEQLIILFPDNVFKKGSTSLDKKLEKQLSRVFKEISPYMGLVEMTFVGHTDSIPVRKNRNQYLRNNFDLSALRASSALSFAIRSGLPPASLSVRGASLHKRNSRTLSIIISPAEG